MANLIEELFKNLIKQDYCNLFVKIPQHVEETVYRTLYLSKIRQYPDGDSTVTKVYFNCSRGTECYQSACPWSKTSYERSKYEKRDELGLESIGPFASIGNR